MIYELVLFLQSLKTLVTHQICDSVSTTNIAIIFNDLESILYLPPFLISIIGIIFKISKESVSRTTIELTFVFVLLKWVLESDVIALFNANFSKIISDIVSSCLTIPDTSTWIIYSILDKTVSRSLAVELWIISFQNFLAEW